MFFVEGVRAVLIWPVRARWFMLRAMSRATLWAVLEPFGAFGGRQLGLLTASGFEPRSSYQSALLHWSGEPPEACAIAGWSFQGGERLVCSPSVVIRKIRLINQQFGCSDTGCSILQLFAPEAVLGHHDSATGGRLSLSLFLTLSLFLCLCEDCLVQSLLTTSSLHHAVAVAPAEA